MVQPVDAYFPLSTHPRRPNTCRITYGNVNLFLSSILLDTQDHFSYTPTAKKQYLIKDWQNPRHVSNSLIRSGAAPSSIDCFAIMDHNGVSLTVRRQEEIIPW